MKRRILGIITAVVLSQCLLACGSSSYDGSMDYDSCDTEAMNGAVEESGDMYGDALAGQGSATESEAIQNSDRKLVRSVFLRVETKEYDEFLVDLQKQIDSLNGYVENMSAFNESWDSNYNYDYNYDYSSGRNASYTIRIPANSLNTFLKQVGSVVNIVEKTESVDDVTLNYVDLDSHVRMLKEEQERLLQFLSEASTMEDIITIENRLSEVKYQLESMSSQLRAMDNKVDYATVTLEVKEVVELTPVRELTTTERIVSGFMDSVSDVKHGLLEFFIFVVTHIPYLVLWGLVIGICFVIVYFSNKVAKKKAEKYKRNRPQRLAQEYTTFVARPGQTTTGNHQNVAEKPLSKTEKSESASEK